MDEKKKLLEEIDLFVLDMDGTFYMGDTIIEGALDFIRVCREKGKQFCFLPIIPPSRRKIISKSWQKWDVRLPETRL